MSHFSMLFPTKSNVKLSNVNMVHAQVTGIILCHFTNCPNIYPVVPVYYCPGKPSNTISSFDLKFYLGFQKVAYEHLEHCDFVYPQGSSWRSPYHTGVFGLSSNQKLSKSNLKETNILWFQMSVVSKI